MKSSPGAIADESPGGTSGGQQSVSVLALHLQVLFSFAVAQPIFDLLGKNPEFFVVGGYGREHLILFVLALTLAPLAGALSLLFLARRLSNRMEKVTFALLFLIVTSALALLVVNRWDPGSMVAYGLSAAAGIGGYVLYRAATPARTLLTALGPAPLVFAVLFLLASPARELVVAAASEEGSTSAPQTTATKVPVVVIVWDEFPVSSLLDERGQIDSHMFPNFGRLATISTWYRNASAASYSTVTAVPPILTGRYPKLTTRGKPADLPIAASYPQSLYSLLGGRYRLNVSDDLPLCGLAQCAVPAARRERTFADAFGVLVSDSSIVYAHLVLPAEQRGLLPPMDLDWGGFGQADATEKPDRQRQVEAFTRSLTGTTEPTLHFLHALYPHQPWQYLPDGTVYTQKPNIPGIRGVLRKGQKGSGKDWIGPTYLVLSVSTALAPPRERPNGASV